MFNLVLLEHGLNRGLVSCCWIVSNVPAVGEQLRKLQLEGGSSMFWSAYLIPKSGIAHSPYRNSLWKSTRCFFPRRLGRINKIYKMLNIYNSRLRGYQIHGSLISSNRNHRQKLIVDCARGSTYKVNFESESY